MKILAPCGNEESLRAAIAGGADEVYLGINEFNARNNIDGFTMATLKDAVDFAHVFGVKVNLALNILFTDDELSSAVKIAVDAYNLGVDSFIIQDFGLAKILQENYPEIEKHASTQMGIHNLEGVKALEKYNFKRIVLARETPLAEVKRIKDNTDVEIEYFAHGALCVSFSGNCYMSSYFHDASGNRGKCKQLCRLPYTLLKDGKSQKKGYLLSAKDFNMLNRLDDLEKAGVDVLKIEGRARRPYYVYSTVKGYRAALNGDKIDKKAIELAFNRGFNEGYFNGNSGIISDVQSHVGIKIGTVEKVNGGNKFNEVFFSSIAPISKKSTLKFFDKNGEERAVVSAYDISKNTNIYRLTTTARIHVKDTVNLIADNDLETSISNISIRKKVNLSLSFIENERMTAEICYAQKNTTVIGKIVQKANNRPLELKEIYDNFNKSELFDFDIKVNKLDRVFVVKSDLNEFRREVVAKTYDIITNNDREPLEILPIKKINDFRKFDDFIILDSVDDFTKIKQKNVIFSPEIYSLDLIRHFMDACERNGKVAYLDTPNFALENDVKHLQEIIDKTGIRIVANNYYALTLSNVAVIGGGLNVYNGVTASVHGLPFISAEDGLAPRTNFPYMTLRHCPIKEHVGGDCANCKYKNGYELKAENGKVMKLRRKRLTTCTFYLTD